nr:ral guanine nucleotide dissociation stimulator-like 1 [Columba livia]
MLIVTGKGMRLGTQVIQGVQVIQASVPDAVWYHYHSAEGDQLPAAHTVSQDETCNSRTLKAGTLEKLVENLLMAFGDNDFKYISVFLSTYRAFASTSTVLELLLDSVIASILQAWLDQCSEDFQEPPNYICLMKVLNYMKRNIPGSDLEKRAQNLLEQFQKEELENDGEVPFSVCCPSVKPGTSPCPGQKASCAVS